MDRFIHDVAIFETFQLFSVWTEANLLKMVKHTKVLIQLLRSVPNFTVLAQKDSRTARHGLHRGQRKQRSRLRFASPEINNT